MPVTDKSIDPASGVAREVVLIVGEDIPISQTAILFDSTVPGFGFYVEKIEDFIQTLTAALTYQVFIGAQALCAATAPTAVTRADVAITATVAQRKGLKTDDLNIKVTTDGTGLGEGLKVRVHIRPYPMGGEL